MFAYILYIFSDIQTSHSSYISFEGKIYFYKILFILYIYLCVFFKKSLLLFKILKQQVQRLLAKKKNQCGIWTYKNGIFHYTSNICINEFTLKENVIENTTIENIITNNWNNRNFSWNIFFVFSKKSYLTSWNVSVWQNLSTVLNCFLFASG